MKKKKHQKSHDTVPLSRFLTYKQGQKVGFGLARSYVHGCHLEDRVEAGRVSSAPQQQLNRWPVRPLHSYLITHTSRICR